MEKYDSVKKELMDFKRNWLKLIESEEQLKIVAAKLYSLSSNRIKSREESQYKNSPTVYRCNIIELSNLEEDLKIERDYCLVHVRKVAKWLTILNDSEVQLLHYRFFNNFTYRTIAKILFISIGMVDKRLNHIYKKIEKECIKHSS